MDGMRLEKEQALSPPPFMTSAQPGNGSNVDADASPGAAQQQPWSLFSGASLLDAANKAAPAPVGAKGTMAPIAPSCVVPAPGGGGPDEAEGETRAESNGDRLAVGLGLGSSATREGILWGSYGRVPLRVV